MMKWILSIILLGGLSFGYTSDNANSNSKILSFEEHPYITVEGAQADIIADEIIVSGGGLQRLNTIEFPYELSFEARMPEPVVDSPDFGIGQVWYSIDYAGESDRLAFAVRGGRLQDIIAINYAQPSPPIEKEQMPQNKDVYAYQRQFASLPTKLENGQWFQIRMVVYEKETCVFINDQPVLYQTRKMTKKRPFCLGGSWQKNYFRNIQIQQTNRPVVKPHSTGHADEAKRIADRKQYQPAELLSLNNKNLLKQSLNGMWLFKPAQENPTSPTDPSVGDENWHTMNIPSFWNPVGCWIYTERQVAQSFLHEEMHRCNEQTFDWRNTKAGFYRHWFMVPEDWRNHRIQIRFHAVSAICVVYCNGIEVGRNTGMFRSFSAEITDAIKPGQKNLLTLYVHTGEPDSTIPAKNETEVIAVTMPISSDMLKGIPRGMYTHRPRLGNNQMLPGHLGGIWQNVELLVCRDIQLEDIWPQTELDKLNLQITANGESDCFVNTRVRIRVCNENKEELVNTTLPWKPTHIDGNTQTTDLLFDQLAPKLWSPDAPNLYTLTVDMICNNHILDSQSCNLGFRTFETRGNKLYLNGKPYRWLGANMPPHSLMPNNRKLAHAFLSSMKKGNQYATRTHASPFPEVWLDEADKLGITVSLEGTWPWLMIGDSAIPSEESLKVWKEEWMSLIKQLRRHPSIVMWTINNEAYIVEDKNIDQRQKKWDLMQNVFAEMRRLDPTRPIVFWSGYVRSRFEPRTKELDPDWAEKYDDGDIDDYHLYAGTYQPSWIACRSANENAIRSIMLPDRPFLSQEAATAYPNFDTGHQEPFLYTARWHSQSWIGNYAYEHRDPRPFMKRHARLTAEQIEWVRRMPIAGWLAFSNATWYCNALKADKLQPYSVYESVKHALAPVLVALDMPVRQFFAGATIKPNVFVVNDNLQGQSLENLKLTVSLESAPGKTITKVEEKFPDVPHFAMREQEISFSLPSHVQARRNSMSLVLKLYNNSNEIIASNHYEITICSCDYTKADHDFEVYCYSKPNTLIEEAIKKAKIKIETKQTNAPDKTAIFFDIHDEQWNDVIQYAESGGQALVFNPQDLPKYGGLENATIINTQNGECAQIPNDRTTPLLSEMTILDMAWWANPAGEPRVCKKSIIFEKHIPENIELQVASLPPHGYTYDWHVEYPVIRMKAGQGTVTLCTMNFSGVNKDPFAARFLTNIITYTLSKSKSSKAF